MTELRSTVADNERTTAWRQHWWLSLQVPGALVVALHSNTALAKQDCNGALVFLGQTANQSRSVWLSATGAGAFALESSGQVVVDQWSRQRRGLRVSLSPDVSNGNGNPHSLFETSGTPCLISKQNQKGGITFPPQLQLPPILPPILKPPDGHGDGGGHQGGGNQGGGGPPTGVMPTVPGAVTPPIGTVPPPSGVMPTVPGGVTPPIATLPPAGVTPTVPGAVRPPIGTVPPSGVMPTVPGAVAPPIGTLPPSGVTPGVPGGVTSPIATLPPAGVMPTVPGAVAPPIGTVPPSGVTPTVPGGVAPPIGTLPPSGLIPGVPGGVTPPIGTVPPPSGVMPTVPGAVTPPIGALPPSGLTPGVPGAVVPPIGTLPPSGVTPGVPGSVTPPIGTVPPPSGVMPTVPGSVAPPIATLPPAGVTPTVPGGVAPPIGTLPPSGVTPGVPGGVAPPIGTLPPSGVTPTVPGGVVPPIARVPPAGVTPSVPGAVTPPVATLPGARPAGLTPQLPDGVRPPPTTLPPTERARAADAQQIARATPPMRCRDAGSDEAAALAGNVQLVDCTDPQQRAAVQAQAQQGFGRTVPITPGREFAEQPLWNVWADARHTDSSDRRFGLDTQARGRYLTLGLDRRVNNDLVAGVSISFENNSSDAFDGSWLVDSNGFSIGPYLGLRLSPEWSLDASLGFGRIDNTNRIDILSGSYKSQRMTSSLTATGQYLVGETQLRPKVSVSFTHLKNDDYDMAGVLAGIPVSLSVAGSSSNYGVAGTALEVNRVVRLSGGSVVVPYAELGVNYEFQRPNDGQMLTGDLTLATPSAWSGTLRLGARALVARTTFVELSAGYLSIGQNGLRLWEGRLFVSHGF